VALLALLRIDVAGGGQLSSAYVAARSELAAKVGLRLWTPGEQFEQAWARADLEHQLAVLGALTQLGVPYKRNASLPGVGFDCSGLTTFAWSMAGFQLPRNSTAQIRAAEPRTFATAQAGDLVRYPGHVMMWLGVGQAIIHSPYPGRHVEIKFLGNRSMKRSKVGDPTE
jgi:cell wall-associated NlpC family hydrolase